MKVILLADAVDLGKEGEVIEVKPGFARHYLLPKKLAKIATEEEIQILEKKQIEKRAKEETALLSKKNLVDQLSGKVLSFKKKIGVKGKMFGSVTQKEIANQLAEKMNIKIKDSDVVLEKSIKEAGEHKVIIKLGEGIEATMKIIVEKESIKE